MAKRRDLNAPPARRMAETVRLLKLSQQASKTGAAGIKDLGENGDITWDALDPETGQPAARSVRDVDAELGDARDRITEAVEQVEEAREGLAVAAAEAAAAQARLDELDETTLPEVRAELEAQAAAAADTFAELDTRLASFATDEALAPLRQALADAADAVDAAQQAADDAAAEAATANANALAAAGIAADKGRIIYQPTAPTSAEDRSVHNLWIDSDNGKVYVWNADAGEWQESENESLRDAAQAAAAALQAAEAAQATATSAAAAAATAQQAAEAAQRTADQSTLDAADAHNAAVAATEKADALRSDLSKGPSLWEDPGFERGMGIIPGPFAGRIERTDEWAASGSHSIKYTASGNGGNNYGLYVWVKNLSPGRWYTLSLTAHAGEHEQKIGGNWTAYDKDGGTSLGWLFDTIVTVSPNQTKTEMWTFQLPEGATAARFWIGQRSDYNTAAHTGQVLYLDDFRLVDVTESYPQYLAAKNAAEAAQAAADAAAATAGEAKELAEGAVREVGDTVRDTVIEYAVGTSETVPPASGWAASTPTRTPGSFVWMRTVVTYADGDTATTAAALLTGNAGAPGDKGDKGDKGDRGTDGTAGKDGVGLQSTAVTYAQSTSGTVAPTTGWTDTVPTLVKGRFLWTRYVWTYTNSTTETGYSVAYVAQDGNDGEDGLAGKDGVGIKSTAFTYAVSSSGTTAPTTGWAAQPPAAAAGQFMWTRTIWTYTDNTTETGYSVGKIGNDGQKGDAGDKGDKGDKGDTGISVSSVTPFFRAVARTAAAPAQPSGMTPSGWTTTEPAWNSTTKLYRAERIVYSNNTVVWTPVSLVAAYEGIVAVAASANGKNAITISTLAATNSTPGVAVGDTWFRVDGDGQIFGQWRWTPLPAGWVPTTIRSDVIANLDVGKLVVIGDSKFSDVVAENLWVNNLVARAAAFQRLTIATGNLFANGDFSEGLRYWRSDVSWEVVPVTAPGVPYPQALTYAGGTVGNTYQGPTPAMRGGDDYVFECWIWADKPNSHFYAELRDQTGTLLCTNTKIVEGGSGGSGSYLLQNYPVPTTPTRYVMEFTARAGVTEGRLASFYFNHTNGAERAAQVSITGIRIRPKRGVVHIEDGQILAEHITASESMSTKILNASSVESAELMVTKGATIQNARLLGETWAESLTVTDKIIGTDGIFTGTVDFANINVTGEILAQQIMAAGGLIAGDPGGSRLEINPDGLVLYSTGPDGETVETARLGPNEENLLTIGSSTISPEGVRAPAGAFDQLNVGGDDLASILEQFPRGMRAWGELTQGSDPDSDSTRAARRAELQTTLEPNRLYRVSLSSHYLNTTSATARAVEELRYSFDLVPIMPTSEPGAGVTRGSHARHYLYGNSVYTVPGQEFMIDTAGWSSSRFFWLMFMVKPESTSWPVNITARADYPVILSVEDVGPSQRGLLKRWNDNNGGGSQDNTPQPVRTTRTWAHGGYGGDTKNGNVYQGTLSPYGNRYGGWIFSSAMRSDLSGSTIEKLEVYLENTHWYQGSGGAAVIYPNNGGYKGIVGSGITSANWPRYAGRWVTLPSSWYASIVNGTYKGVSTYTSNTSLLYYGQFKGTATKFRATYRK